MKKSSSRLLSGLLALVMAFTMTSVSALAADVSDVAVSIPDGENLSLSEGSTTGNTTSYNVVSSIAGYNPYNFSLNVVPKSGVTVTVEGQDGAEATQEGTLEGNTTYWLVTPATSGASSVKITASTGHIYVVNCNAPSGAARSGSGIYAFMPAPGQFTNEGANTGGWGDAYVSGSTGLKSMVNDLATTGVSLGYFGGSIVLDMGENIQDSSTNPYGVDFIVYGNAFKNNSEPGCIQVAPDANNDGKPDKWYNIAGSLHYNADTVWNAAYTYTNPHKADDEVTAYPAAGTTDSTAANNNVPYTCTPAESDGATSGSVVFNTFHRHAWFPLWANYFVSRLDSVGDLAKAQQVDDNGNVTVSGLPFATYHKDTTNGSTLTLTGVRLGSVTNTQTANYTFGYCDVHPNGSNLGVASNPYVASAESTGGDGIDIAWAVNDNGTPANLSSIRFVRIYNGAAKMNGIFGEISTEVCGAYKATGSTSEGTTAAPSVTVNGTAVTLTPGTVQDVQVSAGDVTVAASGTNNTIFVNGVSGTGSASLTTSLSKRQTQIVRIIAKDSTSGNPYIGYIRLMAMA